MKIIVSGSNSQISKSLKKIKSKHKFIFLNKKEFDICNVKLIKKNFEYYKPDILINCAAYTNVKKAEKNKKKANSINNLSLKSLSLFSNYYKTKLIHFSTDYVFDGYKKKKYIEKNITNPTSIYGKTKLEGEKQIINYCKNYLIIRVSWLFSEFENNFVYFVLQKLKLNQNVYAVDDLFSIPTSSNELVNFVNTKLINKKLNKSIYHFVNSGKVISWYEYANAILNIYKKKYKTHAKILPIKSRNFFKNNIRPTNSSMSNKKILNDFDFKIANWKKSLNETINKSV